ncbi:MAG: alpha-mannosidase [Cryomorphaceae bacterium]|jgi:alpha-mannosidase
MQKLIPVIEERIMAAPERFIRPLIQRDKFSLSVEVAHVGGEPIPYGMAISLPFTPFEVGDAWGARWDTTWFKFSVTVPLHWQGEQVVALVDLSFEEGEGFGREGTVWMDGKPVIAVNRNHQSIPVLESALGGEEIEFYVEAAANPSSQLSWGDDDLLMPEYDGERLYKLHTAELATHDEEAYQLLMDFTSAADAMFVMSADQPRRGQLLRALNDACQELEYSNQYCIQPARGALAEVLSKRNGDTNHQINAVGHAHIDTAWGWPIREAIRKCARTFSTVLRHMERYPDYRFVCSQPAQYLWMRKYYPSIYRDIKEAVERGQWEIVGSMWVAADGNISSGESLIRQIIHGKNFVIDEFGIETKDLWLTDHSGYAAALPQILKKSGIEWFLAQNKSGSDANKFPHDSFNWQGLDGSEIFTHIPPADSDDCNLTAAELMRSQMNFRDADRASSSLMPFGYGDGGPTFDKIERARRYSDFEGLPRVEMGTLLDFFEHALLDVTEPPVWKGELHLEIHGGELTSQAYAKMMNRRCELLLRDAEMLQVIMQELGENDLLGRMPATKNVPVWDFQGHIKAKQSNLTARALDRAWKLLLLNQSHHVISGSSIHWVYEDCRIDYSNIEAIALAVRNLAMKKLSDMIETKGLEDPVVIFNSLAQIRHEVVELPAGDLALVTVPQCGYAVIPAKTEEILPEGLTAVTVESTEDGYSIYNGLITLEVNHSGLITSLYDVENSREIIADYSVANLFQLHQDYPNSQNAGDVDFFYNESVENLSDHGIASIAQDTDLRVVIHVSRAFGQSQIEQDIVIDAGSRRIDFKTEVDWQERNRLLKVSFPVAISSYRASFETQYGHVERSTHDNTSWDAAKFEVPAHKWADLSESGYGVALLNDCKYGYDIKGSNMRLTLLKAASAPDPEADRGVHQFTYSLLPHLGSLQEGGVIEQAYALNVPLVLQQTDEHVGDLPPEQSFFAVNRPGVFIEAVKKAERTDDAVVRVYDGYQSRGEVSIISSLHCESTVSELDLMENKLHDISSNNGEVTLKIKPFEIRTIQFNSQR